MFHDPDHNSVDQRSGIGFMASGAVRDSVVLAVLERKTPRPNDSLGLVSMHWRIVAETNKSSYKIQG